MIEIVQENGPTKGQFTAYFDSLEAGHMTYTWANDDRIIIDHTDVNPAYNGKGIGKEMLLKAVEYARLNQLKIIPLCPFAKAQFDKNEHLRDVL